MSMDDKAMAQTLKEQGNEAFKKKRFYTAIEKYSKSLDVYPDPVVLSNRAQAELNTDLHILAQMDCTAAISMDASKDKAYFRRAQAFKALGLFELALQDAIKCEELSKTNADVHKLVEELKGKKNVIVLEACPVRRDDYIQSQEAFTDIKIEYKYPAADNPQNRTIVNDSKTPDKQMPSTPRTYQDFVAAVSYLKDEPLVLAEYFLKIDPSRYNALFDDLLGGEHTELIVKALLQHLQHGRPSDGIGKKLVAISDVSRFSFTLPMSEAARRSLNLICDFLSSDYVAIIRIKYKF